MLLFLLCCTPGVLCFVVVALLVACSRSVAKASSQCFRSVAVCFLAVLRSSCLSTSQCLCSRPLTPTGNNSRWRGAPTYPRLMQCTLLTVAKCKEAFQIVDHGGVSHTVTWHRSPTRPTRRANGINGFVFINGELEYIHICAFQPCRADHKASKYGKAIPPPMHFHLVTDPPAVAGTAAPSGASQATPEAPPKAPPEAPPKAAPEAAPEAPP